MLLGCSVKEGARDGVVFGGKGAQLKELPLPAASAGRASGPCAQAAPVSETLLIDDFEDGDAKPFKGFEREAWWFTASDHTPGSSVSSDGKFTPSPLPTTEANRDNTLAAHIVAAGQTEWGAMFGTSLRWAKAGLKCPLNAAAFRGVKFRAKGPGSLTVKIDVPGTTPTDYGGECTTGCYDAPAKLVRLSEHWDEYFVTWDRLQQGGWGNEVRFDPARVLGVNFTLAVNMLPADFWLDDVAFVSKASTP